MNPISCIYSETFNLLAGIVVDVVVGVWGWGIFKRGGVGCSRMGVGPSALHALHGT